MSEVSDLLDSKGRGVLTAKPSDVVKDVLTRMDHMAAGTCVVMEGGKIVGIMSERDVVKKITLEDKRASNTKVSDVMSQMQYSVTPDTTLDECMKIMTENRTRHLPVIRDAQLLGLVSIGDVVKYLLVEKDFQIRSLETVLNQK